MQRARKGPAPSKKGACIKKGASTAAGEGGLEVIDDCWVHLTRVDPHCGKQLEEVVVLREVSEREVPHRHVRHCLHLTMLCALALGIWGSGFRVQGVGSGSSPPPPEGFPV